MDSPAPRLAELEKKVADLTQKVARLDPEGQVGERTVAFILGGKSIEARLKELGK
jgi:hypothetical protein